MLVMALEAGGQHRADLGAGEVVTGIRVDLRLRLRRQLAIAGEFQSCGSRVHQPARIYHEGGAGSFLVRKADFGYEPVEKRKDLVEGRETLAVGREVLVDRAVAPAD